MPVLYLRADAAKMLGENLEGAGAGKVAGETTWGESIDIEILTGFIIMARILEASPYSVLEDPEKFKMVMA